MQLNPFRDKKTFDSRAYLNFSTVEALTPFVKHFNGHVFLTNKGIVILIAESR